MTPETTENQTSPFPRHVCVSTFDEDQLKLYTEIHDLYTSHTYDEAVKKYRIGRLLHTGLNDERRYGKSIVLNIAFALGMAFSSLYRWAKVAAAYPPEVFEELLQRRSRHGNRLSWSHLVYLARIKDAAERQRLIDTVIEKNLSTDQLAERIKQILAASSKAPPRPRASKTPAGGLRLLQKRAVKMQACCEVFDQSVLRKLLAGDQERVRPEVVKRLKLCETALEEMVHAASHNLSLLRETRRKFDRRRPEGFCGRVPQPISTMRQEWARKLTL